MNASKVTKSDRWGIHPCSIEAARSRYLEAAVLLGTAECARDSRLLEPHDRGLIEEAQSAALHALGPDVYDRAFAEGSAMTLHEAIDYALGAIDSSQTLPG